MKLRVRQTAASIVVALNLVALVGYVAPASAAAADCTQNVSASNVTVSGTSGIDVICVTGTNNVVNAGAGNDTIIVSGSNNTINGGDGNDSIDASNASGPTVENGGPGNDTLTGSPSSDTLDGGTDDDTLIGGAADDTMNGGEGNDNLQGSAGDDNISGEAGEDTIDGGDGTDTLDGGTDDDTLIGGAANDTMNGGEGNDNLQGSAGADNIYGEAGTDSLIGNEGNDILAGGDGVDSIDGGSGLNICDFTTGEVITQSCTYDDSAPVASSMTMSTSTVEVGTSSATFTIHFTLTDATAVDHFGLGCSYNNVGDQTRVDVTVDSSGVASGTNWVSDLTSTRQQVSGTASFLIPLGTAPGIRACWLYAYDTLRNFTEVGRLAEITINRTPAGLPSSPLSLLGSQTLPTTATLSWSAPDSLGSPVLNDYVVQYSTDGSTWITINDGISSTPSLPISNLIVDTDYWFRVRGENGGTVGQDTTYMSLSWSNILQIRTPSATVPEPPTALLITAVMSTSATLSWTAPVYNGGSAITDFKVETSRYGVTWTVVPHTASTSVSLSLSGLAPGTTYQVRVSAVNAIGASSYETNTVTTLTTSASAPRSVTASAVTTSTLTLKWLIPSSNGGAAITDYKVEVSGNAGTTWTSISHTPSNSLSFNVTRLTRAKTYKFRISAITSYGQGSTSSVLTVSTSADVPAAPSSLTVSNVTSSTAALTWQLPANNGGSAITDYKVESSRNGVTWTVVPHTASRRLGLTLSGLAPGTTYQVRVSAVNAIGASRSYTTNTLTTLTTSASAPRSVTASAVTTSTLKLTWLIPSSNGGAAITDYKVEVSGNAGTTWTSITHVASNSLAFNVTRLTRAKTYKFRISAITSFGQGATSSVLTVLTLP